MLWNDILARRDFIKEEETRESAHGIVLDYLRMAGLMDTFSHELEGFYSEEVGGGPSCPEDARCRAASILKLDSISRDMQRTMREIYAKVKRWIRGGRSAILRSRTG
jgi:hypothetical protein